MKKKESTKHRKTPSTETIATVVAEINAAAVEGPSSAIGAINFWKHWQKLLATF